MATRDPNDRGSKDPGRNKSSSTGTGGSSLGGALSKAYGKPGEDNIARSEAKQAGVGALAGKKTEGGGSNTQASPPTNLPTGVTPMSQPAPMGATQYYGSPSLGQILGTVAPALVPGGGVLNNAPSIARGKFSTQNTGGLVGEAIDSLTGQKPGAQTGWSADPSMTPGRDRAQRGTKSRESFDQTTIGSASSTASDETSKPVARPTDDFSDIQMMDRRKPGLKQMLETML